MAAKKQLKKLDVCAKKEKNISFKMAILWNLDLMCKVFVKSKNSRLEIFFQPFWLL